MKGKHKKSCNRFDYGGIISQQVKDLYSKSGGNGLAGAISTSTDDTQRQANEIIKSGYNFNPVAANNDELMDVFNTYNGVNRLGHLNEEESRSLYFNNLLSEINTGASIGGPIGAAVGFFTGPASFGVQTHNIEKDIETSNAQIDAYNARQTLANKNLADNVATRQKLGFEAGYFRDGGDINYFNNGGTHEENPLGGIPQGIAPNDRMNVVEEGEVKWESPDGDYIFSNHQRLNKQDITDNLLPNSLAGKTIADAAKRVLKESDERPYDYISTNGKDHFLNILRDINESKNPQNQEVNSFRMGGDKKEKADNTQSDNDAVLFDAPLTNDWRSRRYPTTWGATNLYDNNNVEESSRARLNYHSHQRNPSLVSAGGTVMPLNLLMAFQAEREKTLNPSGYGSYSGVRGKSYAFQNPERVKSDSTQNTSNGDNNEPANNTTSPQNPGKTATRATMPNPANPKSTTPVTSGGKTPQAAAGETAPETKSYEFGPAFTDPLVTKRSSDIVHNALKAEQNRALSTPVEKINKKPTTQYTSNNKYDWSGAYRSAGRIGDIVSALAPALAAAFDRPNFNYVNEMRNSFRGVDTPYVSSANYMKYTPIDIDYIFNQINRQSQNNMRNIMDLSGGNRNTALAGLFGNDFNTQTSKGNALLSAELQNMQNYQNVQKHNTGINEFDINQYTTNARFNAQGYAQARQNAAMMGQQEYDAWKDREYANLSQALNNMQGIRRDRWTNDQIQMLVDSGAIAWDPRTGQYIIKNS